MKTKRFLLLAIPCIAIFLKLYAQTINRIPLSFNPPVANAGNDIDTTLPLDHIFLDGSASDSGGTIIAFQWTQVSGPSGAVITNPTQAQTTVTNLSSGIYHFQLEATDNDSLSSFDTVRITVNAALPPSNILPQVNAGADTSLTLPLDSILLSGTATDLDGSIVATLWEQIAGPAGCRIVDSSKEQTFVKNLLAGTYHFSLKATDNQGGQSSDTVIILVNPAPNQPPVANAGGDQTIALPVNQVNLSGSGIDNDGTIVSYSWTKLSGPSAYTITSADSANTTVTGLVKGTYIFRLTISDNDGETSSDDVQINVTTVACTGVRRVVVPWPDGGMFYTGKAGPFYTTINPGDTFVLKSSYNTWSYFSLEDVHGTPSCPIVIINEGGVTNMTKGINLKHCSNIKITGSGSSQFYGFYVYNPAANDNAGVAICIEGRSRDIEAERVSVRKKTYGAWIKQDPGCIDSLNYPNWRMDNIRIHDSRFLNIGQDCIYAGNTDPIGSRGVVCNGVTTNPVPIRLSNIHLYNLIVDSCMRTGIQLSGCDSGYNSIHDNIITRCGYENNQQQGTGISIGGMTRNTHVYNNTIRSTFIYGILSFGVGTNYIYDNLVDSSGYLDGVPNLVSQPNSIFLDTRQSLPYDSSRVIVRNNRLGANANQTNHDILVYQSAGGWAGGNELCGNTELDGFTPSTFSVPQGWKFTDCVPDPPGNQPPVANAGVDKVITLPTNQALLHGSNMDFDGFIMYNQWRKISGPSQFLIQAPNNPHTYVQNLVEGVYIFEYSVTDNQGAVDRDTVQVTVHPAVPAPVNSPPVAHAGNNVTITLPTNSYTLSGSGTDSDGTITAYLWSKISGPSQISMSSTTQPVMTISNLTVGVYGLQLTVTDNGGATGRDTVYITVNAAPAPDNLPPVVNAGLNITITLPVNSTILTGTATDPDGTVTGYTWNRISGPASFNLESPDSPNTVVNNLVQGTYSFELRAVDNSGAVGMDTVIVYVLPAPNVPPTANAGSDITITLPTNSTLLNGSGSDPDGSIATYNWTKISGPSQFNIVSPSSAQTAANNLVQGIYLFRLQVTDNSGATASDTVKVTVNPEVINIPPVANAGPNRSVTLPTNSLTLTGSGTDADGTITAVSWTQISGPGQSIIVSPNQLQTVVKNLVQGVYKFELSVTDNRGAVGRDTVSVNVHRGSNKPPVVSAGHDFQVNLPSGAVLLQGHASDPDGSVTDYLWRKLAGPAEGLVTSPSYNSTDIINVVEGIYEFELKATDDAGASATDTVKVVVKNVPPSKARVFPNPAKDIVFVEIDAATQANLTQLIVYDISGKPVYQETFMRNAPKITRQINLGHLPGGTYVIEVTADINTRVRCKLIRQ